MTRERHNLSAILAIRDEFQRLGTQIVAITAARGGSRRIPRKNVKLFCGRPLVEWSLLQAKCSHLVADSYFSTDDEEIAEVGRRMGAKIVWRYESEGIEIPGQIPLAHAMRQIRELRAVDGILTILPTAPLRYPWDFDETIARYWQLRRKRRDVWWVLALARRMECVVYEKCEEGMARQILIDKTNHYLDGGATTWAVHEPDAYIDRVFNGKSWPKEGSEPYYETEPWQCFDLDYPEDWATQEALMREHILKQPDVYERYKEQR